MEFEWGTFKFNSKSLVWYFMILCVIILMIKIKKIKGDKEEGYMKKKGTEWNQGFLNKQWDKET